MAERLTDDEPTVPINRLDTVLEKHASRFCQMRWLGTRFGFRES